MPMHRSLSAPTSSHKCTPKYTPSRKISDLFDIHIINGGPARWQVCFLILAQYCKRWTSSWWVLICNIFSISEIFVGNSVV